MCIAVFRWAPASDEPLVLASNRDEFFERPTLAMRWWQCGNVLAGKDLRNEGTWLGVTRRGRFALLTNVRDPSQRRQSPPSRGLLVRDFLSADSAPLQFFEQLQRSASAFEGFNLLCGVFDRDVAHNALWFFNSTEGLARLLPPGDYGLSNATLDTPWPKVQQLKSGFADALADAAGEREQRLTNLLTDSTPASDDELPATGIPIPMERALSSIFIQYASAQNALPTYGTRASTLLTLREHRVRVSETTHTASQMAATRVEFEFALAHD